MGKLRQSLGLGLSKLGAYFGGGSRNFYDAARYLYDTKRTYIDSKVFDGADQSDEWSRNVLAGVSYNLYGNVGFVKGAVDDKARYSVGQGIFPYASCEDRSARRSYDAYMEQWWDICEVRQTMNFTELERATSKAIDVPGDVGFILTETITNYPQIQAIESHRICSDPEDTEFRDGVKLNGLGRPVAYNVKIRGQNGQDDYYLKIPASSFIHVYEPERFDGVRGVSGLKHGILHIRDKKDILAFEKLGVKYGSAVAATIKLASPAGIAVPTFGGQTTQKDSSGADITMEQLMGGAVVKLNAGESLDAFKSDRPSPTFSGFLDYIDRDVAIGLGLPVEFIWDSKSLGGTNQRFVLEKAQRTFEERQQTLGKFIRRVRNYVISKGIKRGDLPYTDDWWRMDVQGPTKITVDVGREAAANRDDIRAGIRTEQEDIRERGKRFETHRKDIQDGVDDLLTRAKDLKAKHPEIPLEACIQLMQQRNAGGGQIQFQQPTTGGSNGGGL